MSHPIKFMAACAVILASLSNTAFASKELAQSKNCLACHAQARKIIGPSIDSIAAKYPNADTTKIATLAQKVREGGTGVWGAIPMTANPQVNAAESEILVKWFLAGGK
jgi:cytochrome c